MRQSMTECLPVKSSQLVINGISLAHKVPQLLALMQQSQLLLPGVWLVQEGDDAASGSEDGGSDSADESDGYGDEGLSWEAVMASIKVGDFNVGCYALFDWTVWGRPRTTSPLCGPLTNTCLRPQPGHMPQKRQCAYHPAAG